jgi:hypothetical protein
MPTHTDFLLKAGFKVEKAVGFTPVHLRKGITVKSKVELPAKQIVMLARK